VQFLKVIEGHQLIEIVAVNILSRVHYDMAPIFKMEVIGLRRHKTRRQFNAAFYELILVGTCEKDNALAKAMKEGDTLL